MVAAVENRSFIMDVRCWKCSDIYSIIMNKDDFMDWLSGSAPIDKIMHYLSNDERELLISNTCGSCFDSLFPTLDIDE